MKIFLFVLIEGAGFLIDMCQSMKFLSDRECFGKNYRDTGYLKKNSMEWEIYKTDDCKISNWNYRDTNYRN